MREWNSANRDKARTNSRNSYRRHIEARQAANRVFYYKDPVATKSRERENYVRNKAGGLVDLRCEECGTTFQTTQRGATGRMRRFCGRACKDANKNRIRAEKLLASKKPRPCLQCSGIIGPERRSDAFYCSAECNSAAHHHTSKASFRIGAKQKRLSRLEILKRDGFTCYLCGTQREAHELTLDHVIALARGGTHEPDNLKAACLSCNCAKGARPAALYIKSF